MVDSRLAEIEQLREMIAHIEKCGISSEASDVQPCDSGDRLIETLGSCSTDKSEAKSVEPVDAKGHALDDEYAFKRLTRLCLQQERSSKEVLQRLENLGFSEAVSMRAIQRAKSCGLLDDLRYAEILVRSRISQGRGLKGIERELLQVGINPEDVSEYQDALSEIDGDAEYRRAMKFLSSHPPKAKNVRDSAYRKLINKGFSSHIAAQAAKTWAG